MQCLDENAVTAFVERLLSKESMGQVEAHIDACEACRRLLAIVAPFLDEQTSSPETPRPPEATLYTISDTLEIEDQINWRATMRVGSMLRDKWRLEKLLGIGGSAAVYEATHKNHGGRLAIKIMHRRLDGDSQERKRFLREGYAANAVGHPGIIRVVDDDVDEEGRLFLVSELVDGETLQARLDRLHRISADETLAVAEEVLDILAMVHERGIIHRDIKPANVLLAANGGVRLLDFGIASINEATRSSIHATGADVTLGTPAFMPPEQAIGQAEARSDLWALGATMFTLVSGSHVHEAPTVTEMLARAMRSPAPPLASVLLYAPAPLCRVVDRALAFDPGERWASAREMQAEVRRARAELTAPTSDVFTERTAPLRASLRPNGPLAASTMSTHGVAVAATPEPERRSSRSVFVLAVSFALVVVGVVAFVGLRGPSTAEAPSVLSTGAATAAATAAAAASPTSSELPSAASAATTTASSASTAVASARPARARPAARPPVPGGPASAAPTHAVPTSTRLSEERQ